MEYRESSEDRRLREEVREWLHANKPTEARPPEDSFPDQMAYDRAWQRTQYDGGWAGIAWPRAYGGRGLSPVQQLIFCEEYALAHCPTVNDSCWLGVNHAGPTLILRGDEAQKASHLPRILTGEETWCQGFSEPNAGSDLTSLSTRAVVDGDHLVVNGQKIWTTYAHLADFQELLLRTGSANSRHRGLSWVICDMRTPGVDVRPIRALDGKYHNCEVFYDDVRIPLSNVVGEIDEGWLVAMTTLGLERGPATIGNFCEVVVALEDVIEQAGANGAAEGFRPASDDTAFAERLGMARAQLQSIRALTMMTVSAAEQGVDLGPESMITHLAFTEMMQQVFRFSLEMLGPRGLGRGASGGWDDRYLDAFSATIAGGTSEIHRNLIGERLLGLPR